MVEQSRAAVEAVATIVRMSEPGEGKQRFLVHHDYGMGGLWWWIDARSAREILERYAEVEVLDDAASIEYARAGKVEVVDIDTDAEHGPDRRPQSHRDHPDFGKLVGRPVVFLRRPPDPEDDDRTVYFWEVESDGRRLRQVEVDGEGNGLRSTPDDWVFNPPVVDLFAPETATWEISAGEFEAAWREALPLPADD